MRALKLLLLELCIREAKWIEKHPNSLKLQRVPIEEFSQTFDYGLKDITNWMTSIKYLIGKIVLFITQALRT